MDEQQAQFTIKLEVTVDEANFILKSLAKQPFDEVAMLINKIKTQGETQVAAANSEPV